MAAARVRKEELVKKIETKVWKLMTIEVGARGLVASTTYRAFRVLGITAPQAKNLVKTLSEVVVRCSFAIYLAHSSPVWTHNEDLVSARQLSQAEPPPRPNIVTRSTEFCIFTSRIVRISNLFVKVAYCLQQNS